MTTDITELAQREKFEAWISEKPLYARYMHWCDSLKAYDCTGIQTAWEAYQAGGTELVEALEKAQEYAKERDAENQDLMLTVGRLRVERENLECSHNKLRESMAAIHNTVRLDGVNTRLSTILSASKRAYDESSTVSALKSRTVTVKLPPLPQLGANTEWYVGFASGAAGMRKDCAHAITAAGIKWEAE